MTDTDPSPEQVERDRLEALPGDTYPDGRPKMHRHSMSFDIHRDDECDRGVLPDGKWATSRRRVYVFDDDVLPEHEAHIARQSVPVTAPLLATRDALAAVLSEAVYEHGTPAETDDGLDYQACQCGVTAPSTMTEVEGGVWLFTHRMQGIADALLTVVRDPATLAETPDFLYRVTNRAIPLHPTGRVTVTETQAVLRALAAALTEDPS